MADPLWTSAEIARATGGTESGGFAASGVSIDTRSLEPGDLFVALAGVRDGHEFVEQALAKGAAGALVNRDVAGPHVKVGGEVLAALEKLGVAARQRAPQARRAAVTGSVGKTSVTQAIMAGLTLAGPAHSSVKSYNNHIGVPLTLARMPRASERAVFEIGMNHADEIRPLTRMVRPHAALVTTVGPVHTENFPDGEAGVARAKAEVFEGLEPGGVAVLNADNRWFELLQGEARRVGASVRTFGTGEGCDARLIDFQVPSGPGGPHAVVQARLDGKAMDFPILQTGLHWGLNSMAVLLMLQALDVDLDKSLAALGSFEPLAGRGAEKAVAVGGGAFTLIDESYNANPISMASAIATLGARRTSGRRIVALTDMLELGPEAARFHAGLAEPIERASIDLVFCAGPLMKSLWDALPSTRRGGYAQTAAELAPQVAQAMSAGDVVMVKGSNGSKAGLVAQALAALAPEADAGEAG
jgi:UDP-N-acetylmuramoyl-tripeptide--D-alanyl-D-alanine ligase